MDWGRSMTFQKRLTVLLLVGALAATTSACGRKTGAAGPEGAERQYSKAQQRAEEEGSTIWDLFKPSDSGVTVKVNKYIWNASLEVLNFLPVQSVDPFSGVIVTGYGTPPGGGRSYRATIYIKDPALDARSLNVAMQTRGGRPVSEATVRKVEDAILARARQLVIADGKL